MPYCFKCGSQVGSDAKSCGKCGHSLQPETDYVEHDRPKASNPTSDTSKGFRHKLWMFYRNYINPDFIAEHSLIALMWYFIIMFVIVGLLSIAFN